MLETRCPPSLPRDKQTAIDKYNAREGRAIEAVGAEGEVVSILK